MKTKLRGRIREFLHSEEGKVGIKSPLMLGVAAGTALFAQAVVGTPQAEAWQCDDHEDCKLFPRICSVGTCIGGG